MALMLRLDAIGIETLLEQGLVLEYEPLYEEKTYGDGGCQSAVQT